MRTISWVLSVIGCVIVMCCMFSKPTTNALLWFFERGAFHRHRWGPYKMDLVLQSRNHSIIGYAFTSHCTTCDKKRSRVKMLR